MATARSPRTELVEAAREGDRKAFGELIGIERAALVMAARALLGDPHEAEDAAQEALVTAWRHLPGLVKAESFRPWLFRILTRIAFRKRREGKRRRALPDPSGVPERIAETDPRIAALGREVERLPDKFRTLVSLHYLAGLSYRQVAESTGLPEKRVKSRLFEARERLRKRLRDGR